MRYICQLKNGLMLKELNAEQLKVENTGYPYPDTEQPQLDMLFELLSDYGFSYDYTESNYSKLVVVILNNFSEVSYFSKKDLADLLGGRTNSLVGNSVELIGETSTAFIYYVVDKRLLNPDLLSCIEQYSKTKSNSFILIMKKSILDIYPNANLISFTSINDNCFSMYRKLGISNFTLSEFICVVVELLSSSNKIYSSHPSLDTFIADLVDMKYTSLVKNIYINLLENFIGDKLLSYSDFQQVKRVLLVSYADVVNHLRNIGTGLGNFPYLGTSYETGKNVVINLLKLSAEENLMLQFYANIVPDIQESNLTTKVSNFVKERNLVERVSISLLLRNCAYCSRAVKLRNKLWEMMTIKWSSYGIIQFGFGNTALEDLMNNSCVFKKVIMGVLPKCLKIKVANGSIYLGLKGSKHDLNSLLIMTTCMRNLASSIGFIPYSIDVMIIPLVTKDSEGKLLEDNSHQSVDNKTVIDKRDSASLDKVRSLFDSILFSTAELAKLMLLNGRQALSNISYYDCSTEIKYSDLVARLSGNIEDFRVEELVTVLPFTNEFLHNKVTTSIKQDEHGTSTVYIQGVSLTKYISSYKENYSFNKEKFEKYFLRMIYVFFASKLVLYYPLEVFDWDKLAYRVVKGKIYITYNE